MTVSRFDKDKGIFDFLLEGIDTEIHRHPAYEFVLAETGTFSLQTPEGTYLNLKFALVEKNQSHRFIGENCKIRLMLLESNNELLADWLKQSRIELVAGIYIAENITIPYDFFDSLIDFADHSDLKKVPEERINTCLQILENEDIEYSEIFKVLTGSVFLSESRLSHLFKKHIGISVKKYYVWAKLKKVVPLLLNEEVNHSQASLAAGFYDQAHFSKAFKNTLGMKPSSAY